MDVSSIPAGLQPEQLVKRLFLQSRKVLRHRVIYDSLRAQIRVPGTGNVSTGLRAQIRVPGTGIEPVWCKHRGILSPLRLPIPPSGHWVFCKNDGCFVGRLAHRREGCQRRRLPAGADGDWVSGGEAEVHCSASSCRKPRKVPSNRTAHYGLLSVYVSADQLSVSASAVLPVSSLTPRSNRGPPGFFCPRVSRRVRECPC